MNFILKIWIWITFIRNKETLPAESKIDNPKMAQKSVKNGSKWGPKMNALCSANLVRVNRVT